MDRSKYVTYEEVQANIEKEDDGVNMLDSRFENAFNAGHPTDSINVPFPMILNNDQFKTFKSKE